MSTSIWEWKSTCVALPLSLVALTCLGPGSALVPVNLSLWGSLADHQLGELENSLGFVTVLNHTGGGQRWCILDFAFFILRRQLRKKRQVKSLMYFFYVSFSSSDKIAVFGQNFFKVALNKENS